MEEEGQQSAAGFFRLANLVGRTRMDDGASFKRSSSTRILEKVGSLLESTSRERNGANQFRTQTLARISVYATLILSEPLSLASRAR